MMNGGFSHSTEQAASETSKPAFSHENVEILGAIKENGCDKPKLY
jgi:hypothetical protein